MHGGGGRHRVKFVIDDALRLTKSGCRSYHSQAQSEMRYPAASRTRLIGRTDR